MALVYSHSLRRKTYPVDEGPVPRLDKKRITTQDAAEEPVLEDLGVGRYHDLFPMPESYRPTMPMVAQLIIPLAEQSRGRVI